VGLENIEWEDSRSVMNRKEEQYSGLGPTSDIFRKLAVGTNEQATFHSRNKRSPNMSLLLRSAKHVVMPTKITLSRQY
jgi:hypothetical protein